MQIKIKRALCDKPYVEEYAKLLAELDEKEENKEVKRTDIMGSLFEIEIDSKRVGYISCQDYEHKASKSRMCQITGIIIKPEYRLLGYAEKTIDEFIRKNKKDYFSIYCWVNKNNTNALDFFSKVGAFKIADPLSSIVLTKDYTRKNLIELDGKLAVVLYNGGLRFKGRDIKF